VAQGLIAATTGSTADDFGAEGFGALGGAAVSACAAPAAGRIQASKLTAVRNGLSFKAAASD